MKDLREADIFKALSSPTRLEIITLLSECSLCVGALAASLNVTQPAVSQHLGILKNAGLVISRKEGYRVHYSINARELNKTADFLRLIGEKKSASASEGGGCRNRSKQR